MTKVCSCLMLSYLWFFTIYFFQTANNGNATRSTLSFIPRKVDSGKYLSCRAENSIIPSKVLEDGWDLQVQCKWIKLNIISYRAVPVSYKFFAI